MRTIPIMGGQSRKITGGNIGPLWVKSAVLAVRQSLPVYPEKQTFSESVGMSQRCH
jgi:hypothetical protein